MTRVELRKEWEEQVNAFRASDQDKSSWCLKQQIRVPRLEYWLRQFPVQPDKIPSATKWLSVQIRSESHEGMDTLNVRVGAAVIEVSQGYNEALLARIVQTLRSQV